MTEETKQKLINYLTGNYNIELPNSNANFEGDISENELSDSIYNYIDDLLGYIQGKDSQNNNLDIGIVYGNKNDLGVIIVVDKNFNILQVITRYDTGTKFGKFEVLNIDNTGQIYGIDISNNQHRFIMFNNFFLKLPTIQQYNIKLRQSYYISIIGDDSGYTNEVNFIDKNPNNSTYIIMGTYHTENSDNYPFVISYTVNVGSQNDLKTYTYNGTNITDYFLKSYYISWSNDTCTIRLACTHSEKNEDSDTISYYDEFIFNSNDTNIIKRITLQLGFVFNDMGSSNSIVMTNNDVYLSYLEPEKYTQIIYFNNFKIDKINYATNKLENIYLNHFYEGFNYVNIGGGMIGKNNKIYFYSYKNTSSPTNPLLTSYEISYGLINETNIYYKNFDKPIYCYDWINQTRLFNVNNIFNLYDYVLYGNNDKTISAKQIYNDFNYNSTEYQNLNSIIPNNIKLYNNESLIFARNLYNKIISNNTTISQVEIPNTLLNDVEITKEQLLSETNSIITEENHEISKNIYETVMINYYNTLSVINENDINNPIYNILGSTRLNNSISNLNDYEFCKITKFKLNYSNDNSDVLLIPQECITYKNKEVIYNLNIYVPYNKSIMSIQLLSEDENTIYQTIDCSNLELGKSYKITQKVQII